MWLSLLQELELGMASDVLLINHAGHDVMTYLRVTMLPAG